MFNIRVTFTTEKNMSSIAIVSDEGALIDPTPVSLSENHELKKQVANILGIEVSAGWAVLDGDVEKELYLVHFTVQANMNKYGALRGLVVSLKHKAVIARSFGYTPSATLDELKVGVDNMLRFTDDSGTDHVIDMEKAIIKPKFEGTLLRVFKYDGKVYHSTHRRLNANKSRWGRSATFMEMYTELGGPKDEDLFDPKFSYSPFCHLFLIVHPDVLVVSKISLNPGFLVYLGPKEMFSPNDPNFPYKDEIDKVEVGVQTPPVTTELIQSAPEEGGKALYTPLNLTIEKANAHLRYGFYEPFDDSDLEPRLSPGEAIVITTLTGDGQVKPCLIQIQSTAYSWRLSMRENNPNLLHRFYDLVNFSYLPTETDEGLTEYTRLFPILKPYPLSEIERFLTSDGPIIVWPGGEASSMWMKNRSDNLYNIFMCFLAAVPLHRQKEVASMYTHLVDSREAVIEWIQNLEQTQADVMVSPDYSDRIKNIIDASRSFVQKGMASGRVKNVSRDIALSIRKLILQERGPSLYRLQKEMNCFGQDQEDQN